VKIHEPKTFKPKNNLTQDGEEFPENIVEQQKIKINLTLIQSLTEITKRKRLNQSLTGLGRVSPPKEKRNHISNKISVFH
jgi:hypothetical protein